MHSVVNNICLAILKLLQGAKNNVLYVQSNLENKNFDMSRQSDHNWIPTDTGKSFDPSEEKLREQVSVIFSLEKISLTERLKAICNNSTL